MAPLERAMVVSYRLSIVTVAVSVTIPLQLRSNVSDEKINRGWVTLGQNFRVFPLMFGFAESEHPRLTNGEIISDVSNLCDYNPPTLQTDGQTDSHRQTTCYGNTALCTKVHRAVKKTICKIT